MTYPPLLKSLSSIIIIIFTYHIWIKKLRGHLLHNTWFLTGVRARKVSSKLVRAKMHPIERQVGSYKCQGKRCEVCKNVLETDTLTCSNAQTTYKVNHKFDCNEECLVYLITYNKCLKQYVGQPVDMFRSR